MAHRDPRVAAYIADSKPFARPILEHIRAIVHEACPDVQETIKWKFPVFEYEGILANMASFKEHCAFGFWKPSLILEGDEEKSEEAMGQFGRITSIEQLPPRETLIGYIHRAMELNEKGIQPKKKKRAKPVPEMPDDFQAELGKISGALQAFEEMSPGYRREYIEWITEAKRDSTRQRRIAKAVDQISDGKSLNWKYT